jgi:hypothetical protein
MVAVQPNQRKEGLCPSVSAVSAHSYGFHRAVTFRTSDLPGIHHYPRQRTREIPMFPTPSTTQIITPFGSGYVPVEHGDPAKWNLAQADLDDVVVALRASMFSEVLRSLRVALYLK